MGIGWSETGYTAVHGYGHRGATGWWKCYHHCRHSSVNERAKHAYADQTYAEGGWSLPVHEAGYHDKVQQHEGDNDHHDAYDNHHHKGADEYSSSTRRSRDHSRHSELGPEM